MNYTEVLERYVNDSFNTQFLHEENEIIDNLFDYTDTVSCIIYISPTVCRACFSSLLIHLNEKNEDTSKMLILMAQDDPQIKSECFSNRLKYEIRPFNYYGDNLLITRKKGGYLPMKMKYRAGDDRIFDLFMRD